LNFKASMLIASLNEDQHLKTLEKLCCHSPTTLNGVAWVKPKSRPGLRLDRQDGHRHRSSGDAVKSR
jgi:hypothetical protein